MLLANLAELLLPSMLRFQHQIRNLEQIDFEHKIVLNTLKHHLQEIRTFSERIEDVFTANVHHDIAEEFLLHKELLGKAESEIIKVMGFIGQLQRLIEETHNSGSNSGEGINAEKHGMIIHEFERVNELYENIREKVLDFILTYS